jgi:quercetin dioxygenase-like cupin family protein
VVSDLQQRTCYMTYPIHVDDVKIDVGRQRKMAKAGEVITHSISGSKVIFVKTATETNGEYIEVEQVIKPKSNILPSHIHTIQSETFYVISGTARYEINGKANILRAWEEISFPPGTVHSNPIPDDNEDLHVRVTVSPALDFHLLLETVIKASEKGDSKPDGSLKPLHQAVLLNGVQSKVYLSGQPLWLQKLIFPTMAFFGKLAGYKCGYTEN